jgi:hypothetical protein
MGGGGVAAAAAIIIVLNFSPENFAFELTARHERGEPMRRNLITIIESGLACYRLEPRGASGLEGYSLDQVYRFERCEDGKGSYCRVYPDECFPGYYETCGERVFAELFELVEVREATTEQSSL